MNKTAPDAVATAMVSGVLFFAQLELTQTSMGNIWAQE